MIKKAEQRQERCRWKREFCLRSDRRPGSLSATTTTTMTFTRRSTRRPRLLLLLFDPVDHPRLCNRLCVLCVSPLPCERRSDAWERGAGQALCAGNGNNGRCGCGNREEAREVEGYVPPTLRRKGFAARFTVSIVLYREKRELGPLHCGSSIIAHA